MEIQNNGGMLKQNTTSYKSPGGVFFHLLKKEIPKDDLRKIFKRDYKTRNQKKKIFKKMEKLGI
jgi:hypothetical protein